MWRLAVNDSLIARRIVAVVAVLAALSHPLHGQRSMPSDSVLRRVALEVAELDVRRQWVGATAATVDSLMAYYADSVVYEHPSVGAVLRGKASLREGMLGFVGSVPRGANDPPRVVIGAG